jgi:hypothetical protein
MKNKLLGVALFALAFSALTIVWFSLNSQIIQAQVSTNQKWEYKSVDKGWVTVSEDKLNKLGNEGWELVAIETQQTSGQTTQVRYVFKRPMK